MGSFDRTKRSLWLQHEPKACHQGPDGLLFVILAIFGAFGKKLGGKCCL
jgi:hypothetical protein